MVAAMFNTVFGRKTSVEEALPLAIPQAPSLREFLVTLLSPPEELSFSEFAVPLPLLIVLLCTTTPLAEFKLIPFWAPLIRFPVARR
jgi:hypothetical protein